MPPAEPQSQQLEGLPEDLARELCTYAAEHGLSIDDAIVRLAAAQLDLVRLGRDLGIEGFARAPH